jgi:hypothetical protein
MGADLYCSAHTIIDNHMFGGTFENARENFGMASVCSLKHGAQSLPVVDEFESVFFRKLLDLCFSIYYIQRPHALQLILVNRAVSPFASIRFQLASDSSGEDFHVPPPLRED